MIDLRFRPLQIAVARPKGGYRTSPFDLPWNRTLDHLERELKHLGAKDIVIEADLTTDKIRNDGWPYSSAKPATPGIRLSFGSRFGPLSYECATYQTMESNVRAIGRTLECQRAMERYGAVKSGQQYTGWKALPTGDGRGPILATAFGTVEDAARFLLRQAMLNDHDAAKVIDDPEYLRTVYRAAAKRSHPDTNGGDVTTFGQVNAANQMIEMNPRTSR